MFLWKSLDPGAASRALELLLRKSPAAKRPQASAETEAANRNAKGREAARGS
jgi:hypothetical protein